MTTLTSTRRDHYRKLPRRHFSKEMKRQTVEELLRSSVSLAQFARQRDLHYNLLTKWRREYLAGQYGRPVERVELEQQWLAVALSDQVSVDVGSESGTPVTMAKPSPAVMEDGRTAHRLRVVLGKGELLIEGACTPSLLRTVIEALQCDLARFPRTARRW